MEWAMRRKGSVTRLYEGSETRVSVDSDLSEEFEIKVGMHQGSVLTPFLFAIAGDVVIELGREGVPSELLYADDLVLMSEIIEGHRNIIFLRFVGSFFSKGLKVK